MERIEFYDIADFASEASGMYDRLRANDPDSDVSIIAKYDEAKEIIRELLANHDFNIAAVELSDFEYKGYCDEYIISLANIFGTDDIYCEPFKRDDRYLYADTGAVFVLDNCSSECTKKIDSKLIFEVGIEGEYKDDGTISSMSESVHFMKDVEGKPTGFTKTWSDDSDGVERYSSLSFYSTDEDILADIAEEFGANLEN